MLFRCLRAEFAPQGVEVVSGIPGSVNTPLLQESIAANRSIFPDGDAYAAERDAGLLVSPSTAGRFLAWLLQFADNSLCDAAVHIDDPWHQADWR